MGTALGSMGSALAYYAVALLMVIWMVIKIARDSKLLALATFFIWPLAIISLVRNWGNRDSDIRIPFFAALAAVGLAMFMVGRSVDHAMLEAAPYFSDEDLALIASEDPAFHAQIMRARATLASGEGNEDAATPVAAGGAARAAGTTPGSSAVPPALGAPAGPATPAALPTGRELEASLAMAATGLSYLYASVDLPVAHARLALPPRFRFVPALRLQQMARLRNQPLLPGSLGWISHDTVDLGQPDAWVMELRFVEAGGMRLVASGDAVQTALPALAGAAALDGSGRRLGSGAHAPQWDAARQLLTWSLVETEGQAEQRAAVPLRHGVLLFSIAGLAPEQREMGLRATRLLAASVEVEPDWRWQERPRIGTPTAPVSLIEWMQGREPTAAPATP